VFHYILYASSAKEKFSDDQLKVLLSDARENNLKSNITGQLIYCDGNFLQVIEGMRHDMVLLFNKIELDPRHTGVFKLMEGKSMTRTFPDWSMGFKGITTEEFKQLSGYKSIDELKQLVGTSTDPVLFLLNNFIKISYL
jgi:hypothetical protein